MLFCADEKEEVRHLPPIVPVVFYQGETRWQHATEFSELFAEPVRRRLWRRANASCTGRRAVQAA